MSFVYFKNHSGWLVAFQISNLLVREFLLLMDVLMLHDFLNFILYSFSNIAINNFFPCWYNILSFAFYGNIGDR